jgi:hypothetical protein
VKSVFEHGKGIVVCLGLVLTFLHANSVLRQQVSTKYNLPNSQIQFVAAGGAAGPEEPGGPARHLCQHAGLLRLHLFRLPRRPALPQVPAAVQCIAALPTLSAFFIPPLGVPTFYDLVWIVGVNDFVLKFLAVLAKVCLLHSHYKVTTPVTTQVTTPVTTL